MTEPSRDKLQALLTCIRHTAEAEIDCDQLLDHLGAYAEAGQATGKLPAELRKVAQHLSVCPECDEEYQALLLVLDAPPE